MGRQNKADTVAKVLLWITLITLYHKNVNFSTMERIVHLKLYIFESEKMFINFLSVKARRSLIFCNDIVGLVEHTVDQRDLPPDKYMIKVYMIKALTEVV